MINNALYEPFNLKKHNETFTNYCEVIIDRLGKIYYATPSHQMFMMAYYGVKTNQLTKDYLDPSKPYLRQYHRLNLDIMLNGNLDIEETIQKKFGLIMVYFDCYIGKPNKRQLEKLKQLHNSGACQFEKKGW